MITLLKPIITEKSMKQTSSGLYTFLVAKDANKANVAKIVADKFKVKVSSVKIINVKGHTKMQRNARNFYQVSGIKKALVQLEKGQKIGIFEAQTPEATITTGHDKQSLPKEGQVIKEKKSMLRGTKVKVEKIADVPMQTTQRKVITGK